MAWYEEAVFYHIYPLGLTGAPKTNSYGEPVHRLNSLRPWIGHIRRLGFNALYIGPLFESVGHGYETTDYRKLDSRLGTNEDLTAFVKECHNQGIRVIFDGVFNHTGRDFFAFQDLKKNRESSPYRDWYCNVNFWGNNEYNDGFSYDNWGGYNLLVKLNQQNPAVRDYICEVIRFWVKEFDIDGIRLDAADVLNFDFMKALRRTAGEVKPDFWLMGEVIHGDYSRWANHDTLHSVTNYMLHKAFYSGHNDHNYFEIAHTLRYIGNMTGSTAYCRSLYTFVDNHDVERISTTLRDKRHFLPVHILLYTLPGIPSVYYGSEFGIDGEKHRGGPDDAIRPSIHLADFDPDCRGTEADDGIQTTAQVAAGLDPAACQALLGRLARIRQALPALCYGEYEERCLTTTQYAFARRWKGQEVITAVNNDGNPVSMSIGAPDGAYTELLSCQTAEAKDGRLQVNLEGCSGGIWVKTADAAVAGLQAGKAATGRPEDTQEAQGQTTGEKTASEPLVTVTVTQPEADKKAVGDQPGANPRALENQPKADTKVSGEQLKTDTTVSEGQTKADIKCSGDQPKADTEDCQNRVGADTEDAAGKPEAADISPCETQAIGTAAEPAAQEELPTGRLEDMTVAQLQQLVLAKLAERGPLTDRMRAEVKENIWKDSLLNWVKSFR